LRYNAGREETINATIREVLRVRTERWPDILVLEVVTPAGEAYQVELGPRWYVIFQDVGLRAGDTVQIIGAAYATEKVVLAREVIKGFKVLKLRDQNGFPLWAKPMLPQTGQR